MVQNQAIWHLKIVTTGDGHSFRSPWSAIDSSSLGVYFQSDWELVQTGGFCESKLFEIDTLFSETKLKWNGRQSQCFGHWLSSAWWSNAGSLKVLYMYICRSVCFKQLSTVHFTKCFLNAMLSATLWQRTINMSGTTDIFDQSIPRYCLTEQTYRTLVNDTWCRFSQSCGILHKWYEIIDNITPLFIIYFLNIYTFLR